MIIKNQWSFALLLMAFGAYGQSPIYKSRVYLNEKQNQPASTIPSLLIEAYSNGDISAYYPKNLKIRVPYVQFLHHFGQSERANKAMTQDYPNWFCQQPESVLPNNKLISCMTNNFEIGEQDVRNPVTYQQETKLVYLKLIYSNECAVNGLEKEGPVFLIKDIKRLKTSGKYKLKNPDHSSIEYAIIDYLLLRPFRALAYRN